MSQGHHPVLTVRSGQVQRTFAAGSDVVVGSDVHADVRVAHPRIARAHLLLRFEQDRWVAIDNASSSGVFVDGSQVGSVDISDGLTVNLGRPDGPRVAFEVGHHRGIVGLLPPTDPTPVTPPSDDPPPQSPDRPRKHPPRPRFRPRPRPHDPDTTAAVPRIPTTTTARPTEARAPARRRVPAGRRCALRPAWRWSTTTGRPWRRAGRRRPVGCR